MLRYSIDPRPSPLDEADKGIPLFHREGGANADPADPAAGGGSLAALRMSVAPAAAA